MSHAAREQHPGEDGETEGGQQNPTAAMTLLNMRC
jgi:hypothetical protein